MSDPLVAEFADRCTEQLRLNLPRIEKCLAEVTEDEVWLKPGPQAVSIGHLILHLNGNVTQYILSGLAGAPDRRVRDLEFTTEEKRSRAELFKMITATVHAACEVIKKTGKEDLLAARKVQGFDYTGTGIIVHVVEHFSYHVGQISFRVKTMKEIDLGYYAGLDLNERS
jgi:hypothetical protein